MAGEDVGGIAMNETPLIKRMRICSFLLLAIVCQAYHENNIKQYTSDLGDTSDKVLLLVSRN